MKHLQATVSDEEFQDLARIAQELGVSMEEILHRSIAEYLQKSRTVRGFEPIGSGMWAHREEMHDAAQWVHDLRQREWER